MPTEETDQGSVEVSTVSRKFLQADLTACIVGGGALFGFLLLKTKDQILATAQAHSMATIGLAGVALAAICVVQLLEIRSGPIEFEAWGLKFKGAAAPIVFWILIFWTMASAIKLLWDAH